MALTLNGLATGLGVLYPNFREENPSKIVSGFGGTFCLVLSFVYILGSIGFLVLGAPWSNSGAVQWIHVISGWSGFAALSLLIGWLPLKIAAPPDEETGGLKPKLGAPLAQRKRSAFGELAFAECFDLCPTACAEGHGEGDCEGLCRI